MHNRFFRRYYDLLAKMRSRRKIERGKTDSVVLAKNLRTNVDLTVAIILVKFFSYSLFKAYLFFMVNHEVCFWLFVF